MNFLAGTLFGAVLLGCGYSDSVETIVPTPSKARSRIEELLEASGEGDLVRIGDVISVVEDIKRVEDAYVTRGTLEIIDQDGYVVLHIPPTIKQSDTLDTIRGEGWSIEKGDQIQRTTNLTVGAKEIRAKVRQVYKQEVIEITTLYPIESDGYYSIFDDVWNGVKKAAEKVGETFNGAIDQITKLGAQVRELAEKLKDASGSARDSLQEAFEKAQKALQDAEEEKRRGN